MSWSIEEHIGECRPWPAQVVIYRGETDECLAYVSGEVADQLKAENAKLRELVEELWALADGYTPDDSELDTARDLMHELGIEATA